MTPSEDGHVAAEPGVGISHRVAWPVAGALGGIVGAAAFGALLWMAEPQALAAAIPAAYGLPAVGILGWTIHLAHGAILGIVFGLLVTRRPILGTLQANVETDALARTGLGARMIAAGFVYGLAIWAVLPLIVLPAVAGAVDPVAAAIADFPAAASESLLGHLLFGTIIGAVFAATIDLRGRDDGDVLDE